MSKVNNLRVHRSLLFILVFGLIGAGVAVRIFAATSPNAKVVEAESYAIQTNTTVIGDTLSSGTSYLQFNVVPNPDGVPIGDLPSWKQIFVDDFTIPAAVGSWGTNDASRVVYTGDHGGKWVEYPDGWPSTYTSGSPGYQPAQVLSVHDDVLDFFLHTVNGFPSAANPSPLITGTSQYQTYGRYSARIKSDAVSNYHSAWLLWPESDANGGCAESDFPEADLDRAISAFTHNATNCSDFTVQDAFTTSTRFDSGWHIYTQEWGPGYRKYYIDDSLIGTSTTRIWSQPERWQLQLEPSSNSGNTSGHFLVDWVAVYSYNP